MKLNKNVKPLIVNNRNGSIMTLWPVVMDIPFPSTREKLWKRFCLFKLVSFLWKEQVEEIQKYMTAKVSEALSTDGAEAYTICGDSLVLCDPSVCMKSYQEA